MLVKNLGLIHLEVIRFAYRS
uniref:Uncharacterized protein n=1 Tax=Arundo donax TaxID=35708 RepID=A0A0A9FKG4_ARUDO